MMDTEVISLGELAAMQLEAAARQRAEEGLEPTVVDGMPCYVVFTDEFDEPGIAEARPGWKRVDSRSTRPWGFAIPVPREDLL